MTGAMQSVKRKRSCCSSPAFSDTDDGPCSTASTTSTGGGARAWPSGSDPRHQQQQQQQQQQQRHLRARREQEAELRHKLEEVCRSAAERQQVLHAQLEQLEGMEGAVGAAGDASCCSSPRGGDVGGGGAPGSGGGAGGLGVCDLRAQLRACEEQDAEARAQLARLDELFRAAVVDILGLPEGECDALEAALAEQHALRRDVAERTALEQALGSGGFAMRKPQRRNKKPRADSISQVWDWLHGSSGGGAGGGSSEAGGGGGGGGAGGAPLECSGAAPQQLLSPQQLFSDSCGRPVQGQQQQLLPG